MFLWASQRLLKHVLGLGRWGRRHVQQVSIKISIRKSPKVPIKVPIKSPNKRRNNKKSPSKNVQQDTPQRPPHFKAGWGGLLQNDNTQAGNKEWTTGESVRRRKGQVRLSNLYIIWQSMWKSHCRYGWDGLNNLSNYKLLSRNVQEKFTLLHVNLE